MDRELCVLVYSEFSAASKRLIEYIQSLPYDLAAITGMSLFAADTQNARDKLKTLSITTVPCIFVKYFDGKATLYTDENVYAFITAISSAIVPHEEQVNLAENLPKIDIDGDENSQIHKREDVMSAAIAMHQIREEKEKAEKMAHGVPGMIPPQPTKQLKKKTKLV